MNIKFWLSLGVVALIGFLLLRGNTFKTKSDDLTDKLADSTEVLTAFRDENGRLKFHIWNLEQDSLKKEVTIAQLKTEKAEAIAAGFTVVGKLDSKEKEINAYARSLSALKKKAAADRLVGGVGAVGTSVDQEELNGEIASLKGQISNYKDSVVPDLVGSNSRLKIDKQNAERERYKSDTTVLGLKRDINTIQSDVQQKRKQRQKGLGKIFKAGQIRVLDQVDKKIDSVKQRR